MSKADGTGERGRGGGGGGVNKDLTLQIRLMTSALVELAPPSVGELWANIYEYEELNYNKNKQQQKTLHETSVRSAYLL